MNKTPEEIRRPLQASKLATNKGSPLFARGSVDSAGGNTAGINAALWKEIERSWR